MNLSTNIQNIFTYLAKKKNLGYFASAKTDLQLIQHP